jgi:hypothetical protein
MARLLDQPLAAFLEAGSAPAPARETPEVAAFVARVAALAYMAASQAPAAATARALATNSPEALLGAFAELLTTAPRPGGDPVAQAFLHGRLRLAQALEATGGVWRTDEAQRRLQVGRSTLQQWRDAGRVLALPVGDSFVYPTAQFAAPATDLEPPRPYPEVAPLLAAAGDALTPTELAGLLATPQAGLAGPDGVPRTGFAALAAGDGARVVAMVRHVTASPDADAHRESTERAGAATAAPALAVG